MRKVSAIVGKGRQALQDLNLLKVLQSEIRHELSANPFQVPPLLFVISCLNSIFDVIYVKFRQ